MTDFKGLVGDMLGIIIPCCGEGDGVFYQHKSGGSPYKIQAVFDLSFEFIDPETENLISGNSPNLGIRLSDLRLIPDIDDKVTVGKVTYLVTDSLEDGQGGARLIMVEDTEPSQYDERQ